MLENARLSTVKFKNISQQKVSYLPSHFGIYLKKELNFKKCFHFVKMKAVVFLQQKLDFFARKNLSEKPRIFCKLCDKLLLSIYTLYLLKIKKVIELYSSTVAVLETDLSFSIENQQRV